MNLKECNLCVTVEDTIRKAYRSSSPQFVETKVRKEVGELVEVLENNGMKCEDKKCMRTNI